MTQDLGFPREWLGTQYSFNRPSQAALDAAMETWGRIVAERLRKELIAKTESEAGSGLAVAAGRGATRSDGAIDAADPGRAGQPAPGAAVSR